jgi:hypothetical protein
MWKLRILAEGDRTILPKGFSDTDGDTDNDF